MKADITRGRNKHEGWEWKEVVGTLSDGKEEVGVS